jgi:hypothetical protein
MRNGTLGGGRLVARLLVSSILLVAVACSSDPPSKGAPTPSAGGVTTGTAGATPAASVPPGTTVYTQKDNGREVQLPVGKIVVIDLSDDVKWNAPRMNGNFIQVTALSRSSWRIKATGPGRARIFIDGTGPSCAPGSPCPMGLPQVVLHVIVP